MECEFRKGLGYLQENLRKTKSLAFHALAVRGRKQGLYFIQGRGQSFFLVSL